MLADGGTEKQVYEMSRLNSSRVLKKSPLITTVPKLIAQLKYMLVFKWTNLPTTVTRGVNSIIKNWIIG